MNNPNRDYGLSWERELVNIFKEFDEKALRTPNSGAYGTIANVASLQGDVRFEIDGFRFLIEAKAGYGGSKSMSVKREWMDKTIKEAINQRPKRFPILALKFKNSKTPSGKLIAFTVDDFVLFLRKIQSLLDDVEAANDFIFSLKDSGVDISKYIKG